MKIKSRSDNNSLKSIFRRRKLKFARLKIAEPEISICRILSKIVNLNYLFARLYPRKGVCLLRFILIGRLEQVLRRLSASTEDLVKSLENQEKLTYYLKE